MWYEVRIVNNSEWCNETPLCESYQTLAEAQARFDALKATFDDEWGHLDVSLWLYEMHGDEGTQWGASLDAYGEKE